ncbi:DNA-directed DNA polymerase [Ammonifex degensii KC4]|uniref:DNA-directed DNA polymerase n=1 Tax=Ammonifex degensii (strain DSM 10501 / KC4) TaxID=429009 RepID=C9R9F3_AMMDK|nr:exonuclease domain-containing protein [Ammonifex degensii]ACX52932.1 DNA-directed DNA polymerase [Ammonifex degensii KC4]
MAYGYLRQTWAMAWRLNARPCPSSLRELVEEINRKRELDLSLEEVEFVAFDLETTGLKPGAGDEIIALGAVRLRGNELLYPAFDQLVRPGRRVPPLVEKLTGISSGLLRYAPPLASVLPFFLGYLSRGFPLGFNVAFDLAFLNQALKPHGRLSEQAVLDVWTVARALDARCEHATMDEIASFLKVNLEGRHTALGDALIHARMWLKLRERLKEKGVRTLRDLRSFLWLKLRHC